MIKPTAVIISDVHYNIHNIELCNNAMSQAIKKANELKVPFIVAGDLHDTKAHLRGECVTAIQEEYDTLEVPNFTITGNHDKLNEKATAHSLDFLRYSTTIITASALIDSNLYLLPYYHDSNELKEALKQIPEGSTIIMHQGVLGAFMGEYVIDKSSLPKETFANYRVISGHYHRAQDIKCGRPRKGMVGMFSYVGSPFTHSFAEANDGPKGFRILHSDGSLELVPTNLRKHVILERTIDDVLDPDFDVKPNDLLWLKVRGTTSELAKFNKEEIGKAHIGHNNFKLDLIPTDSVKTELIQKDKLTEGEILDSLINRLGETPEQKETLKHLWREIHEAKETTSK